MEKIKVGSISKEFPPLRLYIDEIREVYEVLSQQCSKTLVIQTCGFRITEIDDLSKMPTDQTHDFHIISLDPYLHLDLTKTGGYLYIGDASLEIEGLATRVEKILLKGKIPYPALPKNDWISALFGIPLGLGFLLHNITLIIVGAIIILFGMIWAVAHFSFVTSRFNTIIFKTHKENPSFLKRKKDEIIMLVIGTFVGVIIAKIFDLLIK
jgi:hypothetical protein